MKTYNIEIWSRGIEVGIGTITQPQYDYWEENSLFLGDVLNDNFDYEENETPEDAKMTREYYNEYDDIFFAFGPDMDNHTMIIKDDSDETVYEGDAYGLIREHDEDFDFMYDSDEYFASIQKEGFYVQWCQGGKGHYFEGSFEAEELDMKKFKFVNKETDYGDILSEIWYDGERIDNNAGDYDIKSFEAGVHSVSSSDTLPTYTPTYDYEKVDKVLQFLVDNRLYDVDNLEIGENISDCSEVKIIFDGYGDLEEDENGEYVEGGNKSMESYAIFIHRDSLQDDFEFPEHEQTVWALIHRPREEICIYAWHNVEEESWDFTMIDDTSTELDSEVITKLFDRFYEKYDLGNEESPASVNIPSNAWPFPS